MNVHATLHHPQVKLLDEQSGLQKVESTRKGSGDQLFRRPFCIGSVLCTSKRVGHVVPGVVVYLSFHAWVGWVSEIKYGLIAAARGAFTS